MKWSCPACYSLLAVVALTPVGLRLVTALTSDRPAADPALARDGETLFLHEWKPNDALAQGGDGLGPVYNASSCVACHQQGGVGGAGGLGSNVTMFTVDAPLNGQAREGVVHQYSTKYQETLAQVDAELPSLARPSLANLLQLHPPSHVHLSQRNTPALFGDDLIDAISDRAILAQERAQKVKWGMAPSRGEHSPVGRARRLPGGEIGRFGWKGQGASLAKFVQAACANELGLGNPGQAQPRPLSRSDYQPSGLDLSQEQCDQITAFVASLARPEERVPDEAGVAEKARVGKHLFGKVGCADCHVPDLGGVTGLYSDLLLHRMGQPLQGGGSYHEPPPDQPPPPDPDDDPLPDEWRTPPLWGVADSGPYLHDGRASSLEEAIQLHAGQGARAARAYANLSSEEKGQLVAFLKTLRAPQAPGGCCSPPQSTASRAVDQDRRVPGAPVAPPFVSARPSGNVCMPSGR